MCALGGVCVVGGCDLEEELLAGMPTLVYERRRMSVCMKGQTSATTSSCVSLMPSSRVAIDFYSVVYQLCTSHSKKKIY